MRCCLLHQKLQMLNCCVHHKLSHQQKLNTPNTKTHSSDDNSSHSHTSPTPSHVEFHTPASSLRQPPHQTDQNNGSSSDDEFYEALEDVPQQVESEHGTSGMEVSEPENLQELSEAESCTNYYERSDAEVPMDSTSKREGVLKQCRDLVLITTGQPLCIPITQVSEDVVVCFSFMSLRLVSFIILCTG